VRAINVKKIKGGRIKNELCPRDKDERDDGDGAVEMGFGTEIIL